MQEDFKVVLFCGSSGGIDVLEHFLYPFEEMAKVAVVVVLHRKVSVKDYLSSYLNKKIRAKVITVEHGAPLEKGTVYLVPAGYHCLLENNMTLSLDLSAKVMFSRPSANVSLESFSYNLCERLIAVVVSGANSDGAEGVKWVRKRGGLVIVQNPIDAFAKAMPSAAIEALQEVDDIVPAHHMYNTVAKYF
ncbi:chemotaxis protein CheB [Spongiimicrobium salis]|uniref:chemotaxis protein CheB n=1 Tax=Spongiimicrobium salis TaxID=1667022 RepID=UPI00374D10B7